MKKYLPMAALFAGSALAASAYSDKEMKQDVARHRAMAAAHDGAAKCLEAGKNGDVCEK